MINLPSPKLDIPLLTPNKLEKMKIIAYPDASDKKEKGRMEVLINPDSYTLDYKLKVSADQATGNSKVQLKYGYSEPSEMSFEFLFDNTGIIDGKKKDDITEAIKKLKTLLFEFDGDHHQPPYVILAWGEGDSAIFKGRLTALSINYKLFSPNGKPLRAVAKATFKESIADEERAALEKKNSPDLTHLRTVMAGDTLPMMCKRIYGDPKYYLLVARANQLGNFRQLRPGMEITFPPIAKQAK
jgi:Contractile injection system tube protein